MAKESVFDRDYERGYVEVRKEFLNGFLPQLIRDLGLRTALDVGCGVGYFSVFLAGLGLEVTGVDARGENVAEAADRYPQIRFSVQDVEFEEIRQLGPFDLVLCFGLLYHLENPLRAIRNLESIATRIMIVESMILADRRTNAALVDEPKTENQGMGFIALVPSESCLAGMIYKAGFAHVYRPVRLPDHDEFRSTLRQKRRRTLLVASKVPLSIDGWVSVEEPYRPSIHLWRRRFAGLLSK